MFLKKFKNSTLLNLTKIKKKETYSIGKKIYKNKFNITPNYSDYLNKTNNMGLLKKLRVRKYNIPKKGVSKRLNFLKKIKRIRFWYKILRIKVRWMPFKKNFKLPGGRVLSKFFFNFWEKFKKLKLNLNLKKLQQKFNKLNSLIFFKRLFKLKKKLKKKSKKKSKKIKIKKKFLNYKNFVNKNFKQNSIIFKKKLLNIKLKKILTLSKKYNTLFFKKKKLVKFHFKKIYFNLKFSLKKKAFINIFFFKKYYKTLKKFNIKNFKLFKKSNFIKKIKKTSKKMTKFSKFKKKSFKFNNNHLNNISLILKKKNKKIYKKNFIHYNINKNNMLYKKINKNLIENKLFLNYKLYQKLNIKTTKLLNNYKNIKKKYYMDIYQRKLTLYNGFRKLHWILYNKHKTLKNHRYLIFNKKYLKNNYNLNFYNMYIQKYKLSIESYKKYFNNFFFKNIILLPITQNFYKLIKLSFSKKRQKFKYYRKYNKFTTIIMEKKKILKYNQYNRINFKSNKQIFDFFTNSVFNISDNFMSYSNFINKNNWIKHLTFKFRP